MNGRHVLYGLRLFPLFYLFSFFWPLSSFKFLPLSRWSEWSHIFRNSGSENRKTEIVEVRYWWVYGCYNTCFLLFFSLFARPRVWPCNIPKTLGPNRDLWGEHRGSRTRKLDLGFFSWFGVQQGLIIYHVAMYKDRNKGRVVEGNETVMFIQPFWGQLAPLLSLLLERVQTRDKG